MPVLVKQVDGFWTGDERRQNGVSTLLVGENQRIRGWSPSMRTASAVRCRGLGNFGEFGVGWRGREWARDDPAEPARATSALPAKGGSPGAGSVGPFAECGN